MKKVVVAQWVFPEIVERLKGLFDIHCHDEENGQSLAQYCHDASGILVSGMEPIDQTFLQRCPKLEAVCSLAVGFNNIDVAACTRASVVVTNAPDVLTETTADFGMALLLATARRLGEAERFLRDGHWRQWSLDFFVGLDLHQSQLGIIGMGRIGRAIARRAAFGFGMEVVYHNRSRLDAGLEKESGNARWCELDTLLASADHVLLMLPYAAEAYHLIGRKELEKMKPSATLINLARGGIVDEDALVNALNNGSIAAAGLDVFENEPNINPKLLACKNLLLTPHIASATRETRLAMATLAVDNLEAVLSQQRALTPLNPEVLSETR